MITSTTAVDIAREALEAFNRGDRATLTRLFADKVELKDMPYKFVGHNREEALDFIWKYRIAYPDMHGEIVKILPFENEVGFEIVWKGTHLGEMANLIGSFAPTGKQFTTPAFALVRVEDGKIVAFTHYYDAATTLMQLGLMIPPSVLDANEDLVARFHADIFEKGRFEVADEIIAPTFTWHLPGYPAIEPGPEGVKKFAMALRKAVPDFKPTTLESVAQGDVVVNRWIATGTFEGEWMGVPPTDKPITITGIDIFRVEGGKLIDLHQVIELVGLLQRLGVTPMPELIPA